MIKTIGIILITLGLIQGRMEYIGLGLACLVADRFMGKFKEFLEGK